MSIIKNNKDLGSLAKLVVSETGMRHLVSGFSRLGACKTTCTPEGFEAPRA